MQAMQLIVTKQFRGVTFLADCLSTFGVTTERRNPVQTWNIPVSNAATLADTTGN